MAMLLPQCARPESLHHQLSATIRQRRLYHPSPRGARATHGATESSTHASTDHFKVPSTEPCCNLVSPLVMITPKKPVRRSSRLRVRKGRTDEVKTDMLTDMDAAEWANRVLANNGVVEVDPVTMAELMRQYQQVKHDTGYSDYHYTSSSQESSSQEFFLPASLRFPKVPLGVAVAAGSAVALALVAFLIQSLSKKQGDGSIPSSDSLRSGFSGEPVRSSGGSPPSPPQRPGGNKLPAEVLASGAAVATGRISTPLPPSLSKSGDLKARSQDKDSDSATPFFASDRSAVSSSGATPTSASRWQEDKYKSVRPFFPSDKLAQPVTTFFADDKTGSAKAVTPAQGNRTHGKGSSYESVPPFFPVGKSGSSKVVTPFFADDKEPQGKLAHGKGPMSVTPFFADEQQARNGQSVAPFFPDEQQTKNGPSYMKSVPPFFPDEQQSKKGPSYMESVPPFFPDEQQTRNGPSYMETVPPFFSDEQQQTRNGPSHMETVSPFFPGEQQTSTGRSYMETVPPFFPDEQQTSNGASYMDTVRPFFADERPSSLQDVTPFFGGEAKPPSYMETVQPFFADERQGVSGSVDLKIVKPFFADDRAGSSGAQRDSSAMSISLRTGEERVLEGVLSGPMRSEGKQIANQMAGRAQGPREAFMAGTTADRLKSNNNGDFSFQGQARAPFKEVTLQLSPEELAILAEIKAEEERRQAKMQVLQSAFPALAVGAGAIGAGLVGVDGAFEMVGLTATASFISYELLWANKRQELMDEISRITDHHKLFRFLQKRKIVKDDC